MKVVKKAEKSAMRLAEVLVFPSALAKGTTMVAASGATMA